MNKTDLSPNEKFWDFSVRTYRNEGIADICLSLQDKYGIDVNQLFYCCWYGSVFGVFSDQAFQRSMDFSNDWGGHVVIPLREVRTWMKPFARNDDRVPHDACSELRERVKKVEFEAEKLQEEALERLSGPVPEKILPVDEQLKAAAANLKRYLNSIDVELQEPVIADVKHILKAAIPGADIGIINY